MALSVHLREQVFSLARKTPVRAPVSHTGTPGFSVQPRLPTPASRSRRPWETAVMVPVLGFLPLMGGLGCVPRAEDGPHRYKHLVHQGVGALPQSLPNSRSASERGDKGRGWPSGGQHPSHSAPRSASCHMHSGRRHVVPQRLGPCHRLGKLMESAPGSVPAQPGCYST